MSRDQIAYVGARAPEYYTHTIATVADGYVANMTTVLAARFEVRKPNGTSVTWSATIASASTSSLVLRHEYALDGSDLNVAGTYRVQPWIQTSAGWFPCSVDTFRAEAF